MNNTNKYFRAVTKYLPGFSLIYFVDERMQPINALSSEEHKLLSKSKIDKVALAKLIGHTVYTCISIALIGAYSLIGAETREFNPFKQFTAIQQMKTEAAKTKEQYRESWEKIFGYEGYANGDRDSVISFKECVDAYRRMGLIGNKDVPIEAQTYFSTPTISDLERAIKSYEKK